MTRAFVLALLTAAGLAATQANAEGPAPVAGLPAITVSTVERTELVDRVHASGLVGPVETVQVQPQIQGQAIETLEAEVGDWVSEGQVLARLSDTDLTLQRSQLLASRAGAEAAIAQAAAQLIEAQANADEAARALERARTLKTQGNVAQATLDQTEAAATSARARVAVASQSSIAAQAQLDLVDAQIADLDLKLKRTLVTAPVAGEILVRNALVGAIASSGGPAMYSIIRDGALELKADVAEQDILKLSPGQKVSLRFVGLAAELAGEVRLVEPQVDPATRLGRVRIGIAEPDRVRSGMFANAVIEVARREAPAIPVSAVGGGSDGATAMKVADGRVSLVPIETGIRDGALVELVAGLAPGDSVVTKAGAFVRDGDRINPVPDTAELAKAE